jgi:hypothetical protein
MTNDVLFELLNDKLPFHRKRTPSGWTKLNGVCCLHNGEKRNDTKQRAGLIITADGTITYNCLNCGFKASWSRGHTLSQSMRKLLNWCGASNEEIKKVQFHLFQLKSQMDVETGVERILENNTEFKDILLPTGSKSFSDLSNELNPSKNFLDVVEYVYGRSEDILNGYEYYWCPSKDNGLFRRVIIPFKFRGKIVGWTARAIDNVKLRYYTSVQPNFLFNNDVLYRYDRKYVIIVEGPFDAIAIDGVATLGAKITKQQIDWIRRSGKEIILLPDRDLKNSILIDTAIENGWCVSYPWGVNATWEHDIKDAADAVKKYGRLYTLRTIIENKTSNKLEIKMKYNHLLKIINIKK